VNLPSQIEMLDNLIEIEVAYSLLQSGDEEGDKKGGGGDPIDVHYDKLKTDVEVAYMSLALYSPNHGGSKTAI
jgi:hypothetical protein